MKIIYLENQEFKNVKGEFNLTSFTELEDLDFAINKLNVEYDFQINKFLLKGVFKLNSEIECMFCEKFFNFNIKDYLQIKLFAQKDFFFSTNNEENLYLMENDYFNIKNFIFQQIILYLPSFPKHIDKKNCHNELLNKINLDNDKNLLDNKSSPFRQVLKNFKINNKYIS